MTIEDIVDMEGGDILDASFGVGSRVIFSPERLEEILLKKFRDIYEDADPDIYYFHVGDSKFWVYRLVHDYDESLEDAKEIEIGYLGGDGMIEDFQYKIAEYGRADSSIVLTKRNKLIHGVDFEYTNTQFTQEAYEEMFPMEAEEMYGKMSSYDEDEDIDIEDDEE